MEWFTHKDGKQEGPLSFEEVKSRISQGKLNGESYVFREGFPAWKKLKEDSELAPFLSARKSDDLSVFTELPKFAQEKTGFIEQADLKNLKAESRKAEKVSAPSKKKFFIGLTIGVLVLAGAGTYGYIQMKKQSIPKITDVTLTDYDKLKAAAITTDSGRTAETALSTDDPIHSRIYVSSNLIDGTILKINLKEVPGTIVDPTSKPVEITLAPLMNHVTQTDHLTLSAGEYNLTVTDSDSKPITVKKVFLGGIQDAGYQAALKTAQNKRQKQAEAEQKVINDSMAKLQNFHEILKALAAFVTPTSPIHNKVTMAKVTKLQQKWDAFEKGVSSTEGFWSPANPASNGFYLSTIQQGRAVWQEISAVQADLRKYFITAVTPEPMLQAMAASIVKIDSDMALLKTEVAKINPSEVQ